jgi:hypothetical protein
MARSAWILVRDLAMGRTVVEASRTSGPARRQRPALGRWLVASGVLLGLVGLVPMLIVIALNALADNDADYFEKYPDFVKWLLSSIREGPSLFLFLLPSVALCVAGRLLGRRGLQHQVVTYDSDRPHDLRDRIFYVRPFTADDSVYRRPTWLPLGSPVFLFMRLNRWHLTWGMLGLRGVERYEELLAHAFRKVGTFGTIGDPREGLPPIGAEERFYPTPRGTETAEEAWKREVADRIAHARLILAHIGNSEGVRWEIERIVALADPRRVVLCVNPPDKLKPGLDASRLRALAQPYAQRRVAALRAWTEFREAFASVFPQQLPESVGNARFIRFDEHWSASAVECPRTKLFWFLPVRNPDLSRSTVESALAWLTWIMVPEPFGRRLLRSAGNYIAGFALFFFALALVAVLVFGVEASLGLGPTSK